MKRLSDRLRSYRITPVGWLILITIPAGLVMAGLGPTSAQASAFVIAALAALLAVADILGGSRGRWGKSLAERRAEFGPIDRDASDEVIAPDSDADAWRRERERRAERGR
jgi:hypothetical protein